MPYYLQIGMSLEDYWKGDPYLTVIYRDLERRQRIQENENMWLQGMYIYEGLVAVMHNAFSKKGTSPVYYPKEPYRITPQTKEEKAALAEAERKKAIASFNAWKAAWDKANERRD